ncbi:MAG: RdgB/HAM1 family non-canonical purine NTP pyrophosphatase [Anaerolineales bacterium]
MRKLLLATGNQGKIKEIKALLQSVEAEILTPGDLDLVLQVEEAGKTYSENAARKAKAFAAEVNMLTLADDSGLEVEALRGAPGIYSARYSPKSGATDTDRRDYLLQQLQGFPKPWSAGFHCTVALTSPGAEIHFAEGNCAGEIIAEERGEAGFGYDPVFLVSELGRTMAELSLVEKNQISHRSRAVKDLLPILLSFL